jgi:hypothetical protein
MRQRKHTPEHDIILHCILVPLHGVSNAALLVPALQRVSARGIEFVVFVLCHPDVLLREQRPVVLDAVGSCKEFLRSWRCDFVSNWLSADRVRLFEVLDLECAAVDRVVVESLRGGDGCFTHFVAIAVRIRFGVYLHWQGFFVDDGVLMAVDGWVDPQAEAMLMVLREHAGTDDVAPVGCLACVDVNNGDNTSSARFHNDAACLVEFEGEHVFVVGKRDDELNDEFAAASHNSAPGSPVRVLPVDPVVLFVDADDVWCLLASAVRADDHAVEIFDHAEAVTAELEVIGAVPETAVAEVEGLFAVEWRSWICVWYRLLMSVRSPYRRLRMHLTISLKAIRYTMLLPS